jgi:hypothetical protein
VTVAPLFAETPEETFNARPDGAVVVIEGEVGTFGIEIIDDVVVAEEPSELDATTRNCCVDPFNNPENVALREVDERESP